VAASPSIGGANAKSPKVGQGLANRVSDFLEGAKRKEPKPGGRALATAGAKRNVAQGKEKRNGSRSGPYRREGVAGGNGPLGWVTEDRRRTGKDAIG